MAKICERHGLKERLDADDLYRCPECSAEIEEERLARVALPGIRARRQYIGEGNVRAVNLGEALRRLKGFYLFPEEAIREAAADGLPLRTPWAFYYFERV